jgi:hypothetical protein
MRHKSDTFRKPVITFSGQDDSKKGFEHACDRSYYEKNNAKDKAPVLRGNLAKILPVSHYV